MKLENEEWITCLVNKGNGPYADLVAFLSLLQKNFSYFSSCKYFNEVYNNLIA
ncbi:hypothetical protein btBTCAM1_04300 [Borrelia turicatae]